MEETTPQGASKVQVLTTASCASTSGKSKLTYEVGCSPDGQIQLRIAANRGSGAFSREWIPLRAIREALSSAPGGITSLHLRSLYAGRSVNTRSFLLSVLASEGLLRPSTSKRRAYQYADEAAFLSATEAWRAGGGTGVATRKVGAESGGKPSGARKKDDGLGAAVPPKATQGEATDTAQDGAPVAVHAIPSFTDLEPAKPARKNSPRSTKAKRAR
jgi:hypothetical protein